MGIFMIISLLNINGFWKQILLTNRKDSFQRKYATFKTHIPTWTVGKIKYVDLLNFTHSGLVIMD